MEKNQNPNNKETARVKNLKVSESQTSKTDQGKDTKYLMVAVGIIGIILIGGLIALSIGFNKNTPEITNQSPREQVNNTINLTNATTSPTTTQNTTPSCNDNCKLNQANRENFDQECRQISSVEIKDQCFMKFSNSSFDACKAITNMQNKETCTSQFAYKEQNIEKCSELVGESKNRCTTLATTCKRAEDEKTCLAVVKADKTVCESDEECLFEFAYELKQEEACNQISTVQLKAACKYAASNSDACTQLQYLVQRDACYSLYGAKTKDIVACNNIRGDQYTGVCFGENAANRSDINICKNAGIDLGELWTCYTIYALENGDLNACKQIDTKASSARFDCAFESAKKYGDPSACEAITDIGPRLPCYQAVLIHDTSKLNPTKCSLVTHPTYQNKCYTEAAKKTGDVTYCNNIVNPEEKLSCIDSYQRSRASS